TVPPMDMSTQPLNPKPIPCRDAYQQVKTRFSVRYAFIWRPPSPSPVTLRAVPSEVDSFHDGYLYLHTCGHIQWPLDFPSTVTYVMDPPSYETVFSIEPLMNGQFSSSQFLITSKCLQGSVFKLG